MIHDMYNPEQITWKDIWDLIKIKLRPRKPPNPSVPEDRRISPEMFDRSHLHDWHHRTLADEPKIPEVEAYKDYIRRESSARHQRMLEIERQEEQERRARYRKQQKRSKGSTSEEDHSPKKKRKKKHKTKYQSHRKRGGR